MVSNLSSSLFQGRDDTFRLPRVRCNITSALHDARFCHSYTDPSPACIPRCGQQSNIHFLILDTYRVHRSSLEACLRTGRLDALCGH